MHKLSRLITNILYDVRDTVYTPEEGTGSILEAVIDRIQELQKEDCANDSSNDGSG